MLLLRRKQNLKKITSAYYTVHLEPEPERPKTDRLRNTAIGCDLYSMMSRVDLPEIELCACAEHGELGIIDFVHQVESFIT